MDLAPYTSAAARLIGEAMVEPAAWNKLAYMCDTFGSRMNGTSGQELAIAWACEQMKAEGLDNVRTEPAMVPNWIRGEESVVLLDPYPRPLVMSAYGNSVGTPSGGITADAIVVSSFDELDRRSAEVTGKIVVYCPDWTPYHHNESWENYLNLRQYRLHGHVRAAAHGAKAVLIRSIYLPGARQAHTGAMTYGETDKRIPFAALSPEDAEMLKRMAQRGQRIRLRLSMDSRLEGEVESANVVGEIQGREFPDEVIVLGCQFDSWDNSVGAQDDAAGAMVVWEPLRLMRSLNLTPRRTVRSVLFTNEENGGSGGKAYRDLHRAELSNHVAMLEADSGVVEPLQFRVSGTEKTIEVVRSINQLVSTLGFGDVGTPVRIGTAEDIHFAVETGDIPCLTMQGNNEPYSRHHHAPSDMVEAVSPVTLARATAATAVLAWVLADMPERLPKGKGEGARGTYHG